MSLKPYPSVPNIKTGPPIPYKGRYVVLEKVNGAHFAFYIYPTGAIRCSKRSEFLYDESEFFGFMSLLEKFETRLIEAYKAAEIAVPRIFTQVSSSPTDDLTEFTNHYVPNTLIIYGEIYGGILEDNQMPRFVQKQVQYAPDYKFIAYDMKINDDFISYSKFQDICDSSELPYTKPLLIDRFDICASFNPVFPTTLCSKSLPNNNAEGIIIKPFSRVYNAKGGRIIFKNKNPAFEETTPTKKRTPTPNVIPENLRTPFSHIYPRICSNRVTSVISKGWVFPEDPEVRHKALTGSLIKDAIQEYEIDRNTLSKKERKVLSEHLTPDASLVVQEFLAISSTVS